MTSPTANPWLLLAAILGCLSVVCGAFGAHGLESHLKADGDLSSADHHQIEIWETAARYQMYHALALLAVGILAALHPSRSLQLAGLTFTLGTLIFSGCLYVLVLTGQRRLGAIVPIGGLLLIVGWICLAVAAARGANQ